MVMTDGGEIDEDRISRMKRAYQMNEMNIFTYGEGPESYNMPNVASLACNHRGIYEEIPNMDAIRTQSFQYMAVLSTAISQSFHKGAQLSEPHLQPWTKPHFLVLSLTIPITLKKSQRNKRNTFLGVAGIDIPISHLAEKGVFSEGFPNVEQFMANDKGMLIKHDLLESVKELPLKHTMKVSLQHIFDFVDENDVFKFINETLSTGERISSYNKPSFANIGKYVYQQMINIAFKNSFTNTMFGATPVGYAHSAVFGITAQDHTIFSNDEVIYDVKILLNNLLPESERTDNITFELDIDSEAFHIANWPYCPKIILWVGASQQEIISQILKVFEVISDDPRVCFEEGEVTNAKFDTLLFQNLVSSLYLVKNFVDKSLDMGNFSIPENFAENEEKIADYLITFGGVSYISNSSLAQTSWWQNNKSPKTSSIFQRAMKLWESESRDNPGGNELVFVTRLQKTSFDGVGGVHFESLHATQCADIYDDFADSENFNGLDPIFVNKVLLYEDENGLTAPYAVYGQVMRSSDFDRNFVKEAQIFPSAEQVIVVDEGGFIVSVYSPSNVKRTIHAGDHLSLGNPCLMRHLIMTNIYGEHTFVNNYCSCIKITEEDEKSPGMRPSIRSLGEFVAGLFSACCSYLVAFR